MYVKIADMLCKHRVW